MRRDSATLSQYLAMLPTPYADVNSLLERLLSEIRQVFQEKLVGLYLFGSLTTGDFDPGTSDADLLAALLSDVTDTEFAALRTMHGDIVSDNPEWDDRVEVLYLSVRGLQTFRTEASPITVISPGEPLNTKEADWGWLMNWHAVREKGVTLFGPPPGSLIGPISREEFVRTVRNYVQWLAEYLKTSHGRKSQSYTIVTMCRALYTHRYGEQVSKKRAAEWAQGELPEWSDLIARAMEWRQARRDEDVDGAATYDETVEFASFVISQVQS